EFDSLSGWEWEQSSEAQLLSQLLILFILLHFLHPRYISTRESNDQVPGQTWIILKR
ncbi:mCG1027642, partial [Mus musculus]